MIQLKNVGVGDRVLKILNIWEDTKYHSKALLKIIKYVCNSLLKSILLFGIFGKFFL